MKTQKSVLIILFQLICYGLLAQFSNESLEQAERDFAAYCAKNGIPEAWVKYFSEEGLVFSPGPQNAHEQNRPRIPSQKPLPFLLHWEPYYGAASKSGDLGFNTGPWRITSATNDTLPPQYGYFFSVWKKNSQNEWKVLLDLGIGVPSAGPEHVFGAPYQAMPLLAGKGKSNGKSLKETEDAFNHLAERNLEKAYSSFAATNLLASINGYLPFYSKEVLLAWLAQKNSPYHKKPVSCATIGWEASAGGDFGYSYGSYSMPDTPEKGHYVRVWQKASSGEWYLLAEVCADNVAPRAG